MVSSEGVYLACKYRSGGCPVVLATRQDMEAHEGECALAVVPCSNSCGQYFKRFDLPLHVASCRGRPVSYDASLYQDHLQAKKTCENCGESVAAKDMQTHSTMCVGFRLQRCYLENLGCGFVGTAIELSQHQSDLGPHLQLLASVIGTMREEQAAMRQALDRIGEEYLRIASPPQPFLEQQQFFVDGEVKGFDTAYHCSEPDSKMEALNLVINAEVWHPNLLLHELKTRLCSQVYSSVEEGLSRIFEVSPGLELEEMWEGGKDLGQLVLCDLPWRGRLYKEEKVKDSHSIALGIHQLAPSQKCPPPGLERVLFCILDPLNLRVAYYSVRKRLIGDSCLYAGRKVIYFGPFVLTRDEIQELKKQSKCRKLHYSFIIFKNPD